MDNIFKKTPIILSATVLIILMTAFYLLYREINTNNQKAEQASTEFQDEANRRDEIRLLNNSIETIKEDKALLLTHFARSSDVVPFLDTIEALAPKVGAKAETASVDILKDNTGLLVKINVSGSFKSIYKFLNLLENSPYELEFTSLDMQKEASADVASVPTDPNIPAPPKLTFSDTKWRAVFGVKLLSFIQ